MDISLTPELEKVENGWLAREAALGFAQLEAGQTVTVESKEQFMALVREEIRN